MSGRKHGERLVVVACVDTSPPFPLLCIGAAAGATSKPKTPNQKPISPSSKPILRTTSAARRPRSRGPRGLVLSRLAGYVYPSRRTKRIPRGDVSPRNILDNHRDQYFVLPAVAPGARGAMARSVAANPRFLFTAKTLANRFTHDIQSIFVRLRRGG